MAVRLSSCLEGSLSSMQFALLHVTFFCLCKLRQTTLLHLITVLLKLIRKCFLAALCSEGSCRGWITGYCTKCGCTWAIIHDCFFPKTILAFQQSPNSFMPHTRACAQGRMSWNSPGISAGQRWWGMLPSCLQTQILSLLLADTLSVLGLRARYQPAMVRSSPRARRICAQTSFL